MAPRTEPPEAIKSYSFNLRGAATKRFCKEIGSNTPINLANIVAKSVKTMSKKLTLAAFIVRALIPR